MFHIEFKASAAKEFRKLEKSIKLRVIDAIDALAQDPHPPASRKLRGHESLYRLRVGHYRIIYEIDTAANVILVTRIRHRKDVYRF